MGLVSWIARYLTSESSQMSQDIGAVVQYLALSGYKWFGQMNGHKAM